MTSGIFALVHVASWKHTHVTSHVSALVGVAGEVWDNGSSSDESEDDEVDVGVGETDDEGEEDSNKE